MSSAERKTPWPSTMQARWLSAGLLLLLTAWLVLQQALAPSAAAAPLYVAGPILASIGLPKPILVGVGAVYLGLALVQFAGVAGGATMAACCLAGIAASTGVALRHASTADTLGESDRRYRSIFNDVGATIWVEDYSAVKAELSNLRSSGVRDFRQFIAGHPDFPARMSQLIEMCDANAAALALFGARSKAEFLASRQLYLRDSAIPFDHILETIWNGGRRLQTEAVLRPPGGGPIPVCFSITFSPERPLLDRVVVAITDLSALHRSQEELAESMQVLAHAARLTTMGQLTASITHEITQPLGGILMQAQASLKFLDRPTPDLPEVRACMVQIVDDALRASEILKRLRNFARRGERRSEPIDLNDLVQATARVIRRDLAQYGAHLETRLEPRLPKVRGDRVELQQVLINLVLNSAHATAQADVARRAIVVSTAREGPGRIRLSVSDDGPGLGDADVEHLFQPFVTTKAEGMGLGLAIVRSIVEAHGGAIEARNNAEGGATFAARLPAIRDGRHEPLL